MKSALYGLAGALVALVAMASIQARTSASPGPPDPMSPSMLAATGVTAASGAAPMALRCQPGEQAVVRQELAGGVTQTVAECAATGLVATPVAQSPSLDLVGLQQPRVVPAAYEVPAPAPRRIVRREAQPRRNWAKTAMVIGGSAGAGAGVGGIAGGKKGALIGAAIGGGAATLFEALKK